ncbi:hypothetical protein TSAR_010577 [Trichomalopsis sarcophagae]|uniref:Uncharacterized protein n=1 Tax=Trichomalopsis sarcophagae TaxID=543379 RepID=A0A232EZQ9_9HYME|nr:hypothetical protein TSAR_010577 [Trichomalopsis sarcophagae]
MEKDHTFQELKWLVFIPLRNFPGRNVRQFLGSPSLVQHELTSFFSSDCPVHITSGNLALLMYTLIYESMYKHAVLPDFALFKCKYCVKSVIYVLKVTNHEVY